MDSIHLFNIPKWLPNTLLPEIWAIIFYWKWQFELKDIHKELQDMCLVNKYIKSYAKKFKWRIDYIEWDKLLPGSKLIFEYIDSNICYQGRECTLHTKKLIGWNNYFVIFQFENEDDDIGVYDINLDDIRENLKFVHVNSYNDDMFLTSSLLMNMSFSNIIKYFMNTNRSKEDVMSYINNKYYDDKLFLTNGHYDFINKKYILKNNSSYYNMYKHLSEKIDMDLASNA